MFFTKEDLTNIPVMNDIYPTSRIADNPIYSEAIYNKLCHLDISKSPGSDEWHPRFLKEPAHQLVIPLQVLFRKFIDNEFIPDQ